MRVLTIVLACLTLASTASAQTLSGTETQVTSAAAEQFDPAIDSNLVVYTDFSGVDADVWYTDLTTGTAHPVTTAPGDQQLTGVSGGRVVFTDWNTMDVLVFDVATGVTSNLTAAAGSNSLDPAISASLVAWTDDRDGNAEIYARDLVSGVERRITNDALVDQSPAVGGSLITWERCDGYACDVFVYDWATDTTRQLTATPYASERFPDVFGRTVVFQREQGTPIDKDLVAFNLDTGTEKVLARAGDQENPHISGDYVAFNDSASGLPHIGLWNVATGWTFEVTSGTSGQYLNDIDGNRIVYSDNRQGTLDIWMYTFTVTTDPPPTTLPSTCTEALNFVPLWDSVYKRETGKPVVTSDKFAGVEGPALVCIDNPADSASSKVSSGWVFFNKQLVVGPWEWASNRIERRSSLHDQNYMRVSLASKPGAAVRVRVYAAAPASINNPGGCHDGDHDHHHHGGHHHSDGHHERSRDQVKALSSGFVAPQAGEVGDAMGCSQSGAGELAGWALVLLAAFALLPRPSRLMVRSRRR